LLAGELGVFELVDVEGADGEFGLAAAGDEQQSAACEVRTDRDEAGENGI
jgi:hypothetical protein